MHLRAKLHFQSLSLWKFDITWLKTILQKTQNSETYGQVTKGCRHCKHSGKFGILRAFRKASEEFRKERTRGQRISPTSKKWRKYESKQEERTLIFSWKYNMSTLSEQQILSRARASSLENVKNLNFWWVSDWMIFVQHKNYWESRQNVHVWR